MSQINEFEYVQNWYRDNCDGEWEHQHGVKINTIDNPGWEVCIDLAYTNLENLEIEYELHEQRPDDWYGFSIKNSIFKAAGDPAKLEKLLLIFKEIHLNHSRKIESD